MTLLLRSLPDELVEISFRLPNRQCPEPLREYTRFQRIPDKPWRASQLMLYLPGIQEKLAQIAESLQRELG